jgi:YD repeat-containing protein
VISTGPPGGYSRRFAYDNLGRLQASELTIDGKVYLSQATYDEFGRVAKTIDPSGLQIVHKYNSFGYLAQVENAIAGTVYWKADSRDAAGRPTAETVGNGRKTSAPSTRRPGS